MEVVKLPAVTPVRTRGGVGGANTQMATSRSQFSPSPNKMKKGGVAPKEIDGHVM